MNLLGTILYRESPPKQTDIAKRRKYENDLGLENEEAL